MAPKSEGTPAAKAAPSSAPTAASASSAPATGVDPLEDKHLRSMGYRPETRQGVVFYCRSEVMSGSRLPSRVCGTPTQIESVIQHGQETMNQIERTMSQTPPSK
ncbi:MAG TPA: hypothetical protein VGF89_13365 [Steroidobacteraceae bacterium]